MNKKFVYQVGNNKNVIFRRKIVLIQLLV